MAINKGLSLATGDWIARIDDDDIWTKDHLKHSLDLLYKTKSEFVSSKRIELRDGIYKITKEDKKWIYASLAHCYKSEGLIEKQVEFEQLFMTNAVEWEKETYRKGLELASL
jgi:cellulose synthase/poly-beta-1,6-N-acetylglucosamine synthase-like glycosyltransferase